MSNTYLTALNAVRDIVTYDLIPPFDGMSPTDVDAPLKIQEAIDKLNEIINILNNYRKPYFSMFSTQMDAYSITANGQVIPLSMVTGDFGANADGSFNVPSGRYNFEVVVMGNFSVSGTASFVLYDADSGLSLATIWTNSENYNSVIDYASIRSIVISGSRRMGLKVNTKQASGTLTLTQYATYIKVTEV